MERPFPAYQGDEPYIFVSYAHEDAALVYSEIQWLKDQGFNIWYDEGISPGHEWRQELAENIENCSLFLYFVSPGSVSSDHCVREVNYALDQKRPLLVVHLKETELPSTLAMSLSPIQAILRYELKNLDYRIKLLRSAGQHLDRGIGVEHIAARTGFGAAVLAGVAAVSLLIGALVMLMATGTQDSEPELVTPLKPARIHVLDHGDYRTGPTGSYRISQDGDRVIYSSNLMLHVRNTSNVAVSPIPGTEGIRTGYTISPDGQWVAFYLGGELMRVPMTGGKPVTIAQVPGEYGISWGPDQEILASDGRALYRVNAMGGEPVPVTTPAPGEWHRLPSLLPDGHTALLTINAGGTSQVAVLDLGSDDPPKVLLPGNTASYTPTGHLLFYRDGAMWAAQFDADALVVRGSPVLVVPEVGNGDNGNWARFSYSRDGTAVYETLSGSALNEIVYVDREGDETRIGSPSREYREVAVSPDGERIAAIIGNIRLDADVWIFSRTMGNVMRLTFDAQGATKPVWFNDGTTVAYTRFGGAEESGPEIVARDADGTGGTATLLSIGSFYALSRDEEILTRCQGGGTDCDLWIRSNDSENNVKILLDTDGFSVYPVLSPDHRWVAYFSTETGDGHVHVRPFPDVTSGHWIVSDESLGGYPFWSPDGRELLYRRFSDNKMISVPVETERTFVAGQPTVLFDATPYVFGPVARKTHDMTPDGQHFVMIKPVQDEASKVLLMENFFDELERLVPTKH